MKKPFTLFMLLLGLQLLLSSCVPGPQILQPGSPTQESTIEVMPTPSAGNATITGILKQVSSGGSDPIRDTLLALGKVLQNDLGTPMMGQLDSNTKLRCKTDENGRFIFLDVPEGKYVLVFDRLVEAFMLKDPITGGDLIIIANPNRVVDLGVLVYEEMP